MGDKERFSKYAQDYLLRAGVPEAEPGYVERLDKEEFDRDVNKAKLAMQNNATMSVSEWYKQLILGAKDKGEKDPSGYADRIVQEISKTSPELGKPGTGMTVGSSIPLFRFMSKEDLSGVPTGMRNAIESGATEWHKAGRVLRTMDEARVAQEQNNNLEMTTGAGPLTTTLGDAARWVGGKATDLGKAMGVLRDDTPENPYLPETRAEQPVIGNTAPPLPAVQQQNTAASVYRGLGEAAIPAIPETLDYNTSDLSQYLQ